MVRLLVVRRVRVRVLLAALAPDTRLALEDDLGVQEVQDALREEPLLESPGTLKEGRVL